VQFYNKSRDVVNIANISIHYLGELASLKCMTAQCLRAPFIWQN